MLISALGINRIGEHAVFDDGIAFANTIEIVQHLKMSLGCWSQINLLFEIKNREVQIMCGVFCDKHDAYS